MTEQIRDLMSIYTNAHSLISNGSFNYDSICTAHSRALWIEKKGEIV